MLNKSLLLCANSPVIMFKLVYKGGLGYSPNTVDVQYTYTDPSTKQIVTKTVNSTDSEYTFPCAVGDTISFTDLIIGRPERNGWGTWFRNGVDVSPTSLKDTYAYSFNVTVSGKSPYIEYCFMYGPLP